jgi:hypothetical protein
LLFRQRQGLFADGFVSSTMVVMPAMIAFAYAIVPIHSLNSCEPQGGAIAVLGFMLVMAAIWGLQMLDKAREKDEQSKVWLPFKEFLQDEYRRMNRIIRLDQGASVLLCVEAARVGMYAVPFLSTGLLFACWGRQARRFWSSIYLIDAGSPDSRA